VYDDSIATELERMRDTLAVGSGRGTAT
jgi:hypothetical protein